VQKLHSLVDKMTYLSSMGTWAHNEYS